MVMFTYYKVGTSITRVFFTSSPKYYNKKMKLAVMHFNSLTFGELSRTRVEIGNCLLPRKGKIAISVKRKMTKGEHPWRKEV